VCNTKKPRQHNTQVFQKTRRATHAQLSTHMSTMDTSQEPIGTTTHTTKTKSHTQQHVSTAKI